MKIVIINDTHAGCRNSSDIFIEYQERFYTEVLFPYMLEHDIKHIFHAGDYYDNRKYINFKALNSNRKVFLDKLKEYGFTMDIICGNHDVYYKSTNDLCSLKELLGYYTSNVNIIMEPKVLDYAGLKVAALPWINNENYSRSVKFISKCDAPILIGHLELNGFEMMKGITNTHGMEAELFKRFEMVLSGHFHTKSQQGNITYLGSQMEFTWADAHDPKYFHVLDTETRELTPVLNPITIFTKVYYNDEKNDYSSYDFTTLEKRFVKVVVSKKTDPFMFDRFIDGVQNAGIYELKIAESFDEFMGDSVEDEKISLEDTSSLLDTYVEAIETDLDKDRLKSNLHELYVEAQNLEIL